jgi:microcystin-dependent protein
MSEQFLGEIRMFAFNFPPNGWALCNGQTLPINQNQALFSLLGTTYGGNGTSTFGLPDLQSRAPIHVGTSVGGTTFVLGSVGGEETHTLTQNEMPSHPHTVSARATASTATPTGASWATSGHAAFSGASNLVPMSGAALANGGGGQPHDNMQPFLAVNFCIALVGIFPSRN